MVNLGMVQSGFVEVSQDLDGLYSADSYQGLEMRQVVDLEHRILSLI